MLQKGSNISGTVQLHPNGNCNPDALEREASAMPMLTGNNIYYRYKRAVFLDNLRRDIICPRRPQSSGNSYDYKVPPIRNNLIHYLMTMIDKFLPLKSIKEVPKYG